MKATARAGAEAGPGAEAQPAAEARPGAQAGLRAAGLAMTGGALLLIALTFDSVTLFVPGLGLIALAALAALWALTARFALSVVHAAPAARAVEGEPVEVMVEITRRLLRPRRMFLDDPLAGAERRLWLPASPATVRLRLTTSFARRGRVRLPEPALRVTDPLGLVALVRRSTSAETELLVLPAVEPVRWGGGLPSGERGERQNAGQEPLGGLEVDGLRPYRTGTPASRIHWPSLARGNGLMERRLQSDADDLPLVLLDPASPRSPEHLDRAVRAAASLILELGRREGCRLVVAGAWTPVGVRRDLTGWATAHELLALVEADPHRQAGELPVPPPARRLLIVCAEVPRRLAGLGSGAVIWVLPDDLLGERAGRPVLSVSGCRGHRALEGERLAA